MDFLDAVHRRYGGNPDGIMDTCITGGRFSDFVAKLTEWENDRDLWELWLHKYFGKKSFPEWREEIRNRAKAAATSKAQTAATVRESLAILEAFDPEQGVT